MPDEASGKEWVMSIRLGGSGLSYDLVNGVHRTPDEGDTGKTTDNRERFQIHKRSYRNESVFGFLALVALALLLLGRWYLAMPIVVGLVYWLYWSGAPASQYLAIDPDTGYEVATDPKAELMLGYGRLDLPYIQQENKLRSLIVSAKTLPPEMCDATCAWRCVELDDSQVVFEITVGDASGVVPFFKKSAKEFAAYFGDPDRHEFQKVAPKQWRLVFFSMPQDPTAGVEWE